MTKNLLKFLCASFACLVAFGTTAQTQLLYQETFENGMPADYTILNLDGLTPHPNVGGVTDGWVAPNGSAVSTSWYDQPGTSNDWMITSAITLPTDFSADIALSWFAQAPDADFRDKYDLRISTTTTEVDSFKTTLYTTGEVGAPAAGGTEQVSLADYAGETIYLAFINNSNDKYLLIIDNISIFDQAEESSVISSIENSGYYYNEYVDVEAVLVNTGANDVQSVEFNYSINDGYVVRDTIQVSGSPSFLESFNVTASEKPDLPIGIHKISAWTSAINGVATQADTAEIFVSIFGDNDLVETGNPLVEVFTSATCPPCNPGNIALEASLSDQPVEVLKVNYQQDFPGDGDPYTTAESVTRRALFGINSIPGVTVQGGSVGVLNPNSDLGDDLWSNAKSEASIFDLDINYKVIPDNQTVEVNGTAISSAGLVEGTNLMLAIIENETDQNVASNGETKFHDVFKKFVNGINGIDIGPRDPSDEYIFSYSYIFNGNYRLPANGQASNIIDHAIEHSVEDFGDLRVDGWIEYPGNLQILQAKKGKNVSATSQPTIDTKGTFTLAPNITESQTNITLTLDKQEVVDIAVYDMNGQLVSQLENQRELGAGTYNYQWSSDNAGLYVVQLRTKNSFIGRELLITK